MIGFTEHDERIAPEDLAYCDACKREVSTKWNYCPNCGRPVNHQTSEAQ